MVSVGTIVCNVYIIKRNNTNITSQGLIRVTEPEHFETNKLPEGNPRGGRFCLIV